MKIGVYVGSFNPVHEGHIKVINYLIDNNYVDKVLVLPTGNYWDKQDLADVYHRVNMLKFYENDKIIIDNIHNKYHYTFEVLNSLQEDYKNDILYLIIGSDNLEKFHLWKNIEEILKYKVIVLKRGKNINKDLLNENFIFVDDFDCVDISSTIIRGDLNNNCLSKEVRDYIKRHNLYGG